MQPELIEDFLETGIISPARMRVVDINAIALGVTESPVDGECRTCTC